MLFVQEHIKCPNCGKKYNVRTNGLEYFRNLFSRKCMNCGLRLDGENIGNYAKDLQQQRQLGPVTLVVMHKGDYVEPTKEALPFIKKNLSKYGIDWVNKGRVSEDFKFLIYGRPNNGRQIGIYGRETTVIRLEKYDQNIEG